MFHSAFRYLSKRCGFRSAPRRPRPGRAWKKYRAVLRLELLEARVVFNTAPVITSLVVNPPVTESNSIALTGTFTDTDTQNPHAVVINWGDNSPNTILNLAPGVFNFSAPHLYPPAGPGGPAPASYSVSAEVVDNVVVNGGFEQPALTFGTQGIFQPSGPGAAAIPGWSLVGGSGFGIKVENHVAGSPAEGAQFVQLDSNSSTDIGQSLATVPGQSYAVGFAFSAQPGFGPSENHLGVEWGGTGNRTGQLVADLTADGTGLANTSWQYYTFTETALSGSTLLEFDDLGLPDGEGTYLDNVFAGPAASRTLAVTVFQDAPLTAGTTPVTLHATERAGTGSQVVATFTDTGNDAQASLYSGTINWGDGHSDPFTSAAVSQNSDGSFSVRGSHTYAEEGSFPVIVTIDDAGGSSVTATNTTFQVQDAPLAVRAGTLSYQATEQAGTGDLAVATFTDPGSDGTASDYSATIHWGDGSSSTGTVVANSDGSFSVHGSHLYAEEKAAGYAVTVDVADAGGSTLSGVGSTVVKVADAALQDQSSPAVYQATEQAGTGDLVVASFSDPGTDGATADYGAVIHWGDGSSSTGTVTGGDGSFSVHGSHTYAEQKAGGYAVTVDITDQGGSGLTAIGKAVLQVADASLQNRSGPAVYQATEQAGTGDLVVATFTDPGTDGTTADYGATIHWGDGLSSAGSVQKNSDGSFSVHGSHTYAEQSSAGYVVTVDVTDAGGSSLTAIGQSVVKVADAALADHSTAVTFQATEQAGTGDLVVATFTDPGTDGTAADYGAVIHWGDGTSGTGSVQMNSDGSFAVHGSHTYAEEKTAGYAVTVDVTDSGGSSLTGIGKAVVKVADATLTDQSISTVYQATEQAGTGDLVVATFSDPGTDGTTGDYGAVIHWGDGTSSAGTVQANGGGSFSVHGSHTYAEERATGYAVTVDVTDSGGSSLAGVGHAVVKVADATLHDQSGAVLYQATEQATTGDLVVASFSDPGTDGTTADYGATIHWGDGLSSAGTVQKNSDGSFSVHGSHTYAEEKAAGYAVTVDLTDAGGSSLAGIGDAVVQVADAALQDRSGTPVYQATEQAGTGDVVVATFADPGTDGTTADYGATIHWGDGLSSTGTVQKTSDGSFAVHGSHTYAEEKASGYAVTVDVTDQGGSALTGVGHAVVQVADAALADRSTAAVYQATEQASTGDLVVATFSDPGTDGTTADYGAVIHWGDGTSSTGTVQVNEGGTFSVHGSHTYAEEKAAGYVVTVDVTDQGGSSLIGIGRATIQVADAALQDQSVATVYLATEQAGTGDVVVATFADPGTDGTAADYGAVIHWGDGSSSTGTVQGNGGGSFSVHGSHVYAEENAAGYAVTVDVTDAGGRSLAAIGRATVEVADAQLIDRSTSAVYQATEQAGTGDIVVATFADPGTDGTTAGYGATIHWGDGTSSAGTVQKNSDGSFSVHGSHTYAEENAGGYSVLVDVTDQGGSGLTDIGAAVVQVADAALQDHSGAAVYQATEQAGTGDLVVATFTDPGTDGTAADYSAVIHWGDGTSCTGSVQMNSDGSFSVHGSHTYAEEKTAGYSVTVDVTDQGGSSLTAIGKAVVKVADAALQYQSAAPTFQATEQAGTGDLVVATFSDAGSDGTTGDYSAVIHWGDGTSSAGTVQADGDSFAVVGSHTYAEQKAGGYAVTVDITDQGGSKLTGIGKAVVQVADAALQDQSSPAIYQATEQASTGDLVVATFSDPGSDGTTADYGAVIHWGDGLSSAGSVQKNSDGSFSVHGSHTYAEENSAGYAVTVDVTDIGGSTLSDIGAAVVQVADAALQDHSGAATFQATEQAGTGDLVVATFTDPGTDGTAGDYSAVIHWGDGATSTGSVQKNSDGSFSVHGSHSYAEEKAAGYAVTVDVTDQGGSTLTGVGHAVVKVADATLQDQSGAAVYQATEQAGTGDLVVATFSDPGSDGTTADYGAVIHWGDGTSSAGTVQANGGGSFAVHGSHTYAEEKAAGYAATVDITDAGGSSLTGVGHAVVKVADAALQDQSGAAVFQATEQASTGDLVVASFSDPGTDGSAADYTAVIHWGDGLSSAGSVQKNSDGSFAVHGSHTYAEEKAAGYAVTVDVTDQGGSALTGVGHAVVKVADATLQDQSGAAVYQATEQAGTGDLVVATFSDPGSDGTTADYGAVIHWGDGLSSAGSVQKNSDGSFAVHGSHTYAEENTAGYAVTVDVTDQGGSTLTAIGQAVVKVADAALADHSTALTAQATEQAATGDLVVATFTDPGTDGTAADYSAVIHWGDGTSCTGSVQMNSDGSFSVRGNHTYAEENAAGYAITVDVTDQGGSTLTGIGKTVVKVADAALQDASPAVTDQATEQAGTGDLVLATFADPGSDGTAADYSGTIVWGDGHTANFTAADVTANDDGTFSVHGSHTYAEEGSYAVRVTIRDAGGSTLLSTATTVHVQDAALGPNGPSATLAAVEGVAVGAQVVASFTDPGSDGTAADYSGTIAWGDGQTTTFTAADVVSGGAGRFGVVAGHAYAEEGSYTVTLTVHDVGGSSTQVGGTTFVVGEAASPVVTIGGAASVLLGQTYTLNLASLGAVPGTDDIQSWTIVWGDGTTSLVPGNPPAVTHVYQTGPTQFQVTATANDEDGTLPANTLAVTVTVPGLASSAVTQAAPGSTAQVTLPSNTNPGGPPLVAGTLTHASDAAGAATLLIGTYLGDPNAPAGNGGLINVTTGSATDLASSLGFFEVNLSGMVAEDDAVVATFSYPAGADPTTLVLSFLDPLHPELGYQPITSSTAFANSILGSATVDKTSGLIESGPFQGQILNLKYGYLINPANHTITARFDATSNPKVTGLGGTVFTVAVPVSQDSSAVVGSLASRDGAGLGATTFSSGAQLNLVLSVSQGTLGTASQSAVTPAGVVDETPDQDGEVLQLLPGDLRQWFGGGPTANADKGAPAGPAANEGAKPVAPKGKDAAAPDAKPDATATPAPEKTSLPGLDVPAVEAINFLFGQPGEDALFDGGDADLLAGPVAGPVRPAPPAEGGDLRLAAAGALLGLGCLAEIPARRSVNRRRLTMERREDYRR